MFYYCEHSGTRCVMNQYEEMQTFIRIVDAGSITKAAEQMNTVKSAVSRRLTDLEKRLGVSLITRTTRTQTLTDSGKSYYEQCSRLIDDLVEVESQIRNEHCALKGKIRIAAPLSFGLSHLGSALRKFNDINPDIQFDIDFNDRKVDIVEEGFDLAIRISKLEDSTLIARKIATFNIVLCASPGYLNKYGHPKTPKDLEKGHVKLHYKGQPELWSFYKNGETINVKIPTTISTNNGDFLCEVAIDDRGLLYTPDFICYKAIRLGQLEVILPAYTKNNQIDAYAVYPQTRHLSQRVRNLVDYLAQYFDDKSYWSVNP
ncbi:MAG: DNA-binding transcriptional LysR family regulator [Polaribacter sp.]|jgi:DNA-binding transcriptional LysR family regulator